MSGTTCSICLNAEADTLAIPCGHVFGCRSCANRVQNQSNKCPICRAPIQMLQTIRRCGEKRDISASSAGGEASAAGNKKARIAVRGPPRLVRQTNRAPDILQTARTAAASAAAQPTPAAVQPTPAAVQSVIERCFRGESSTRPNGPATFRGELSTADEFIALWTAWKQKVRTTGRVGPSHLHEEQFFNHVMPFLRTITQDNFMLVRAVNGGLWFEAGAFAPVKLQVSCCTEGFSLTVRFEFHIIDFHWYEPNSYHAHVILSDYNADDANPSQGGWKIDARGYAGRSANAIHELPRSMQLNYVEIPDDVKAYILSYYLRQSSDFVGDFADSRNMIYEHEM